MADANGATPASEMAQFPDSLLRAVNAMNIMHAYRHRDIVAAAARLHRAVPNLDKHHPTVVFDVMALNLKARGRPIRTNGKTSGREFAFYGDGPITNIIVVHFSPIDKSGCAHCYYADDVCVRRLLTGQARADQLRLVNVAPVNDEAYDFSPRRRVTRFTMTVRQRLRLAHSIAAGMPKVAAE